MNNSGEGFAQLLDHGKLVQPDTVSPRPNSTNSFRSYFKARKKVNNGMTGKSGEDRAQILCAHQENVGDERIQTR